jgi:hypothetical protein
LANARNGNTFYVDASSGSGTASSYIDSKNTLVVGIFATASADTDVVLVSDKAAASAAVQTQH